MRTGPLVIVPEGSSTRNPWTPETPYASLTSGRGSDVVPVQTLAPVSDSRFGSPPAKMLTLTGLSGFSVSRAQPAAIPSALTSSSQPMTWLAGAGDWQGNN